jgi:hypothetical protein
VLAGFREQLGSLPTLESVRDVVRERAEHVVDAILEELTREAARTGHALPVVEQNLKLALIAVATRALDLGEATRAFEKPNAPS